MNIRNNKKTASLLLAGIATGAAAWYLFGTDNGKKSISQLTDAIKDLSDLAIDKANDTFANIKAEKNKYIA